VKIALVTAQFLPFVGGAEMVAHHLACQWQLQGHDVCVINYTTDKATHPGALYSVRKYSILRGSTRFGDHKFPFRWYAARNIKRLLREFNPDFISAHFGFPTGVWLSKIHTLPKYIITCHGAELNKLERPRKVFKIDMLLADSLNKSSGVIAISTYARKVMEEMGVESSSIFYIPNGIDRERFRKSVNFDFRKRFKIPKGAMVILSVGRDNWIKAFDTGIKAFAKFHAKMPDAYYVILGHGNDRLLPLARELGVSKNIIFGQLYGDELTGAYQQSNIFFSSSVYELCPVVVLEAMAAGLPTVVTNVSGSQDMIKTGDNGIVVEPGNPDKMADALYELATDKSLQKRFGSSNLKKSEFYDWKNISRMYLEHV
jgi:glycosyltransferase involved in cell wall biosynthesis